MGELKLMCEAGLSSMEPYSHKTIPSGGSSTSTVASSKDVIHHTCRGVSLDGAIMCSTQRKTGMLLVPGQQVNYTARSHSGEYKATVLGRVTVGSNREAWPIRVECGGDKIVEDWEL